MRRNFILSKIVETAVLLSIVFLNFSCAPNISNSIILTPEPAVTSTVTTSPAPTVEPTISPRIIEVGINQSMKINNAGA